MTEESGGEEKLRITEALPTDVLADLAKIVLAEETLDTVLSKVAELTKQVIEEADEVSLTLVRKARRRRRRTPASSPCRPMSASTASTAARASTPAAAA